MIYFYCKHEFYLFIVSDYSVIIAINIGGGAIPTNA